MATLHAALDDKLIAFIGEQPMFFVATAPSGAGHVNLSPKGADTFRVLDAKTCCYLDLTGSGNETAAHVRDNGRLTVMFTSFTRKAQILRLYGKARIAPIGSPDWQASIRLFPDFIGKRQLIFLDIEIAQTSCGYAVPEMQLARERETHIKWAENKGPEGLRAYRAEKNLQSIDGMPTGFVEG